MSAVTAVADANSVIGLVKGGVFDLVSRLFAAVYVPTEVREEVVVRGQGRPGSNELAKAVGDWIAELAPDPAIVSSFRLSLSQGDREVLAVAQAQGVDYILTDDLDLRREANHHQLACLRVAEVVVLLKAQGLVPEVKPVLDRMRQANYGIRADVYEQVLRTVGEWHQP